MSSEFLLFIFGITFASFTALVGVIWAMLNKRINGIEDRASEDRAEIKELVQKLFDRFDELTKGIANLNISILKNFVAKTDCEKKHNESNRLAKMKDENGE